MENGLIHIIVYMLNNFLKTILPSYQHNCLPVTTHHQYTCNSLMWPSSLYPYKGRLQKAKAFCFSLPVSCVCICCMLVCSGTLEPIAYVWPLRVYAHLPVFLLECISERGQQALCENGRMFVMHSVCRFARTNATVFVKDFSVWLLCSSGGAHLSVGGKCPLFVLAPWCTHTHKHR